MTGCPLLQPVKYKLGSKHRHLDLLRGWELLYSGTRSRLSGSRRWDPTWAVKCQGGVKFQKQIPSSKAGKETWKSSLFLPCFLSFLCKCISSITTHADFQIFPIRKPWSLIYLCMLKREEKRDARPSMAVRDKGLFLYLQFSGTFTSCDDFKRMGAGGCGSVENFCGI